MDHDPLLPPSNAPTPAPPANRKDLNTTHFFYLIFALKFCNQFTKSVLELPFLRLVEHTVCRSYVDNGPEEACKTPRVQDRTALVIGYRATFDALPCLLTAWYYGALSNSRGRRFVMMLSNLGQLLALVWVILVGFVFDNSRAEVFWLSSVFLLLGGGTRSELAMQYASLCDAVPEHNRTRLLSLLHAAAGVAGLVGYPICSVLLRYQLWAPFTVAVVTFVIKHALLYHMPETAPYVKEADEYNETNASESLTASACPRQPWLKKVTTAIDLESLRALFGHRGLRVMFACFVVKRVGFASLPFASQHASEILHRKLYETFWLGTFQEVGALLALTLLLPFLVQRLGTPAKELLVIRGSAGSLMTGFLILWQSRSMVGLCLGLVICGLGEGLETGMQALGSYIVGEAHHGAFFSFISMLGVTGELLGGPLMARFYAFRSEEKQVLGYCFLASAVCFGSIFVCSYLFKAGRLSSRVQV